MVRALMDPDGLRVVTLNDPGRLVETLEQVSPALLLMDVSMRDFDGIALTRGLRADLRWRSLPIVLFSSEADAGQRRLAYAALADDFVAKPIVPDELRRRLRHQLDRVRLTRLGEGQHPGTGLSLPVRTLREATRLLEGASGLDTPRALALIRPTTMPTDGASSDAWMQECGRLAHVISLGETTLVGMCDDTGLIAITRASSEALRVALVDAAARRSPKGVVWTAGIADTSQRAATFDALCTAAAEARELVTDDIARCWTPDDERVAPDVVVVEDDQALSDMVQYALRSAGFTFRAYANGTQALEALLALRPGPRRVLVLLDVDLPGMDGHSLHERLRITRPGQFAVVFTTARASEAEQLRALRGGAIDYVTKPIALRVLVAKVKVWLELAGVRPS
jgi:DNA-binding response OmpR family regulator